MEVDLVGAALLVTALAGAFTTVVTTLRTARKVDLVHDEVTTMNGQTMAVLADRVEGRRIEADIDEADRTPAEQNYVTKLTEASQGEIDEGQQPPK